MDHFLLIQLGSSPGLFSLSPQAPAGLDVHPSLPLVFEAFWLWLTSLYFPAETLPNPKGTFLG